MPPHDAELDGRVRHSAGIDDDLPAWHVEGQRVREQQRSGVSATPPSVALPAGQSATFQVVVTPQGGPFTGPVTLGCSQLPQQVSCTFNPPVLTPGAASVRSTLTISTTSRA